MSETTGQCGTACQSCEPQTPLRNHYFFGKLMDVPDFEVEQAYGVEKRKRHHARLHGTGTMCGLMVGAHPNPACRDRWVTLSPGSALDCCGNEILVIEPETIDLSAFPAVAALAEEQEQSDHVLLFCIRYLECPIEEVPVLYDACGCDDTRCAPNRILETYAIEVLVDPELPAVPPNGPGTVPPPELEWAATLALADPVALALHPDSDRAYLAADLGGGPGGTIAQYRMGTLAPLASHNVPTRVLDLAASADGTRLAAAVSGATAADPARLIVLDTGTPAAFAGAQLDDLDLPGSDSPNRVRVLARGNTGLVALAVKGGNSRVHRIAIGGGNSLSGVDDLTLSGLDSADWALGGDGATLYLAPQSGFLESLDLEAATLAAATPGLAVSGLTALSVVQSSAPDLIAWTQASGGTNRLHLARPDGTDPRQADLADPPVDLAVDPGGHQAYLLLQPATGNARVLALDLHRLLAGDLPLVSNAVEVGPGGLGLALEGDRLWVLYQDGAALIAIERTRCEDYLEPGDCPDCPTPDCVVLATVANYRPGRRLEDPADPPSDPLADAAAGIARIDNRTWRRTVPRVTDLALAVRCLLERCCGGEGGGGEQGPPGDPGQPGAGIDAVTVETLDCGTDATAAIALIGGVRTLELGIPRGCDGENGADGADGTPGTPGLGIDAVTVETLECGSAATASIAVVAGERTLQLGIPRGCDGADGDPGGPGLDPDLPHICDISWDHGGEIPLGEIEGRGLIVAFDTDVHALDLHDQSIHLQVARRDPELEGLLRCWCDLDLSDVIQPGRLEAECRVDSEFIAGPDGAGMARAVRIRPPGLTVLISQGRLDCRLLIDGDFIRGIHRVSGELRALDADHIPKPDGTGAPPDWLRPGDPRVSGDGVEGGTFTSWFTVRRG